MTGAAAARMAEQMSALLDALDPPQRDKASFSFDDTAERTDWAYFPRDHKGLALGEMNALQQKRTHALLASSLSLPAYAKTTTIMSLENVLNLLEERRADRVRDPGRYYVSVFGAPGDTLWGWRFEGHHVCLNFTLREGTLLSPTPIFFGANPASVEHGHATIVRPCSEEEDAARELLASLDTDQRAVAVLLDVAPPDFVLTNAPFVPDACLPGEVGTLRPPLLRFDDLTDLDKQALRFDRAAPRGLAASKLNAAQRKLLSELVDVYIERLPEDSAALERARIERDGGGNVHFAWAGSDRPREGH
ncbi:MAG TPA: DUF3500 domain-containing protein, partial [Dehalococcoidia bacterium]